MYTDQSHHILVGFNLFLNFYICHGHSNHHHHLFFLVTESKFQKILDTVPSYIYLSNIYAYGVPTFIVIRLFSNDNIGKMENNGIMWKRILHKCRYF
jgi:hypothetical protein